MDVRVPLLVTLPCLDYREYSLLHICLAADFLYYVALIPARMVANFCYVQRAISGYPSSSTRTIPKTRFIHKERNTLACAALNSIVRIIKAQNCCFFFVKKIIFVKFYNIAGGLLI